MHTIRQDVANKFIVKSILMRFLLCLINIGYLSACKKGNLYPYNLGESAANVSAVGAATLAYYQDFPLTAQAEAGKHAMETVNDFIDRHKSSDDNFLKYLGEEDNLLEDPWGNPYWISWIYKKSTPIPIDALVWSSGPNHINEFGQGDDISSLNANKAVGEPLLKGGR